MGNPPSPPRSPIALLQSVTKLLVDFKSQVGYKETMNNGDIQMTNILFEALGAVTLFAVFAFFLIFVF